MIKRVFLDGRHTAVIKVNENRRTVTAELETEDGCELVYAEKFDKPCNYEKEALKSCLRYLKTKTADFSVGNVLANFMAVLVIFLNLALP